MKKLITILSFIFLVSCMSQRKVMDSWMGHGKQELVQSWGPPHRIASDGNDGEIYMYGKLVQMPSTGGFHTPGYVSPSSPGQTIYSLKMFYINSDGRIYHWLIQNSQVPPQQVQVEVYRR